MTLYSNILKSFDLAVFSYDYKYNFIEMVSPPEWFISIYKRAKIEHFRLLAEEKEINKNAENSGTQASDSTPRENETSEHCQERVSNAQNKELDENKETMDTKADKKEDSEKYQYQLSLIDSIEEKQEELEINWNELMMLFPFLSFFLSEITHHNKKKTHRSDLWEEKDEVGNTYFIELQGVYIDGMALLIIKNRTDEHQKRQEISQEIREMLLQNEQLHKKLKKHLENGRKKEIVVKDAIEVDPVTLLPSRLPFKAHLLERLNPAIKEKNRFALCYLNLDNFKEINLDMSHNTGDYLLRITAYRLKEAIQHSIFVGIDVELFYLGADEFVLILDLFNATEEKIEKIIQFLQDAIKRLVSLDNGRTLSMTMCAGVACFPIHGTNDIELLKHANMALYQAKRQGRSSYKLFSPNTLVELPSRLYFEEELFEAINSNYLSLAYQPQVHCHKDKTILKLEALIRWDYHLEGFLDPNIFIPIAENLNAINAIGNWVLEEVCKTANAIEEAGFIPKIAVNISIKQLMNKDFVQNVRRILTRCHTSPLHIELEVKEEILLADACSFIPVLESLRKYGINISLDNAGRGNFSLKDLKRFPIDTLKIDRYFISDLVTNKENQTLVDSVIAQAHKFDLDIVAEGVEHQTQFDYLKEKGCDYVQGFLFYHPMFKDELLKCLHEIAAS